MGDKLVINVSKDKMSASMIFVTPEPEEDEISVGEVLALIKKANVVYGVNEEYIKTIYEHRDYEREYKIAEGKPPVNGKDGVVTMKFDFSKKAPKIDDSGRVDYLNVDKYISVKKDEVLAEYTVPTQGISGVNVCGDIIKAKNGKQAHMPIGKNVMVVEENHTIVSKIDGLLELISGRLYVEPLLYINSDVDLSTGNIDFIGNIQVRGSVRNGMSVKAQGNVSVDGMVESANVEAGGDILLNGGIKGMGKANVKAGRNVTARYIESANVYAKGTITATAVLQSNLEAEDGVDIIGSRGSIIGGTVRARNFVKCKNIGSANYIATNVMVGLPPELRKEKTQLEADLKKLKAEIVELEKVSNIPTEGLSAQQVAIKERLLQQKEAKSKQFLKDSVRLNELEASMQSNTRSYISVEDTTFTGAVISINNAILNVRSEYKFTTFRETDGEITANQHS